MSRKKKPIVLSQPVKANLKTFKVRLDGRTIITISNLKALEFWRKRYPNAQVIY